MDVSYTIDPKEVHQLASPHAVSPSRLIKAARLADRLAIRVENEWEGLSPEGREILTAFAYDRVREHKGVRERLRLQWLRMKFAYTLIRGQEEMNAVIEYVDSMQRLIDAILLAIEHEDEAYQARVTKAVERAISKPEMSEF